jgi:hypothetical protein
LEQSTHCDARRKELSHETILSENLTEQKLQTSFEVGGLSIGGTKP